MIPVCHVVDSLLDESDTPSGNTIWTALKPIVEASGDVHLIKPYEMANNLYLIPGDISLLSTEEELPTLWSDCYQSKSKDIEVFQQSVPSSIR